MPRGRPKGTRQTPEGRARIGRANAARWKDPDYREKHTARLKAARKESGNMGGRKRGSKQSPETIEKIRQTMIARWRDPDFRARHLPHILSMQATVVGRKLGFLAGGKRNQVRPPKGTPERRLYNKISRVVGSAAAREVVQW